jgi:nitroreductase
MAIPEPARSVLDLARWAPSADNTQPWRFEVLDGHRFAVHFHDTRDHCVYDLDGRISQIAWGALLESIQVAASGHGCQARFATAGAVASDGRMTLAVTLEPDASLKPHSLLAFVKTRSTQRRCMSASRLLDNQKSILESAVAPEFRVIWMDDWRAKRAAASMLSLNGKLRLLLPEAFDTHRGVIEWATDQSEDRIPDRAIGLDPMLLRVTRWAFESWSRVDFLNRYLAGTVLARLELDVLPALFCAAHFALVGRSPLRTTEDYVSGGRAVQRFWLTAESMGLRFQPSVSPLVFARYASEQVAFTRSREVRELASRVRSMLEENLGGESTRAATVFTGRLGLGKAPQARSGRLPLPTLAYVSGAEPDSVNNGRVV